MREFRLILLSIFCLNVTMKKETFDELVTSIEQGGAARVLLCVAAKYPKVVLETVRA